jgi:hypothetical protein
MGEPSTAALLSPPAPPLLPPVSPPAPPPAPPSTQVHDDAHGFIGLFSRNAAQLPSYWLSAPDDFIQAAVVGAAASTGIVMTPASTKLAKYTERAITEVIFGTASPYSDTPSRQLRF